MGSVNVCSHAPVRVCVQAWCIGMGVLDLYKEAQMCTI